MREREGCLPAFLLLCFCCREEERERGEEAGRGGGHVPGGGILKARQWRSFRSIGPGACNHAQNRCLARSFPSSPAFSSACDLGRFFSLTAQFRHI